MILTPEINQSSRGGSGKCSSPISLSILLDRNDLTSLLGVLACSCNFPFSCGVKHPDPKSGREVNLGQAWMHYVLSGR